MPMVQKALDDLLKKAAETPLQEGEVTVMFQAWPLPKTNRIKVAVVAVDIKGNQKRKLWGPEDLDKFVNSEVINNINFKDLNDE